MFNKIALNKILGRLFPKNRFNNTPSVKKRDEDEMRAFISIAQYEFKNAISNGNFEIIDDKNIRIRINN